MRRKSTRNQNKSLERSLTDSPQSTSETSNTRSSRRRKRSPSTTNDVEDKTLVNYQNNGEEAAKGDKSLDNSDMNITTTPDTDMNDSKSDQLESNNRTDTQQENIVKDDKEMNQQGKGKSKGKNKTRVSRIDIEPETDDAHGEPKSPPNDNNKCIQNSVDSTPKDLQKSEIIEFKDNNKETEKDLQKPEIIEFEDNNKETEKDLQKPKIIELKDNATEIENSEQSKAELESFESEYVDKNTSSRTEKVVITERTREKYEGAEIEERSTTPELPNTLEEKPVENQEEKSEKGGRKRITLKRLPPQTFEEKSKNQEPPKEENSPKDISPNKTSKKITLKRQTIDEIPLSSEKVKSTDLERRSSLNETTSEGKRLSSQLENQEHHKDVSIKSLKRVKLNRNISLESSSSETSRKPGKHTWGKSEWLEKISSTFYKIDVESIKTVCPTLEFLKESDIKLKEAPRERVKSESTEYHKRKLSSDKSEEESEKHTSEPESAGEQKIDPNPNIIALNRKISIVDDTASKLRPPASPAKNPKSDILYITNLVRPFTVKQLKELLERTGKIREDGFWTDRIKSKCYAHYETDDEAEATRNALHGVSWPIGNGKQLVIDFGTEEDMQKAKNPVPAVPVVPEILPEKENREPDKLEIRHKDQVEEKRQRDTGRDRSREEHHQRHSRSRSRERVRKHSRRSYTPEILMKKKPKKEEVPQKLMDDLFLKTKATPSIYWQPLCPQEIALKQQQRLVRMEEHKRRIEETRTRLRDVRRVPFRRR